MTTRRSSSPSSLYAFKLRTFLVLGYSSRHQIPTPSSHRCPGDSVVVGPFMHLEATEVNMFWRPWSGEELKCKVHVKAHSLLETCNCAHNLSFSSLNISRVRKETHPQWTETFDLNYEFGSECYFLVQVYRLIGAGRKIESLGNAVCEIGDILGSKNHTKVKRLPKGGV